VKNPQASEAVFWIAMLCALILSATMAIFASGCGDPDDDCRVPSPTAACAGSGAWHASVPSAPIVGATGGWNHPDAGAAEGGAP
jgi:hypothetical protein